MSLVRWPTSAVLWIFVLATTGLLAGCGPEAPDDGGGALVGTTPPSLEGDRVSWLHVDRAPTLESLKGKVVYLEFAFPSCPHCRRMWPVIDGWYRQWKDRGLEVIEVELGSSVSLDVTRTFLQARGVAYPVLYDGADAVTHRYGVTSFPTGVVIDRQGKVVWHGFPAGNPKGPEAAIRRAIGG